MWYIICMNSAGGGITLAITVLQAVLVVKI